MYTSIMEFCDDPNKQKQTRITKDAKSNAAVNTSGRMPQAIYDGNIKNRIRVERNPHSLLSYSW